MAEKILLRERGKFLAKGINIPEYVWRTKPFAFAPATFGVSNERLNEKLIGPEVQKKSLASFIDNPLAPCIYGVASAPSDDRAKYFAAYLVQQFVQNVPPSKNRILWHYLYADFKNPLIANDEQPSLLVITGLTPNSTPPKLEKARDLLEHYCDIPRIVVIAGEDPITFFASRLYFKLTHLFFHCDSIVKRTVQTV